MTIDLGAVPEALGDMLTISDFAAGILLGIFVCVLIVVVVSIFTQNPIVLIVFIFVGSGLTVALGWFPYWILFIEVFVVALLYAFGVTKMLAGGK